MASSWAEEKAREIVRRYWAGNWSDDPELELKILEGPFAAAIREAIDEAARRCEDWSRERFGGVTSTAMGYAARIRSMASKEKP